MTKKVAGEQMTESAASDPFVIRHSSFVITPPSLAASELPGNDVVAGFWLLCGLFVALRLWVGWREGLGRQVFALAALGLAWWAAFVAGPVLAPGLRPFLAVPDFLLSALAGALVGLVVYNVVNILGRTLARRTREREPGTGRLAWGVGGAVLGGVGALVSLWVVCIGVRLLGSVAEGHVRAEAGRADVAAVPRTTTAREVELSPRRNRPGGPPSSAPASNTLEDGLRGLARVKRSLETGVTGEVMAAVDPVPVKAYATLNKLARVVSDPAALGRFRDGVLVRELGADPRLTALLDDPAIARDLAAKDYRALLTHPRLRAVANDPTLSARLRGFDLEQALDVALRAE